MRMIREKSGMKRLRPAPHGQPTGPGHPFPVTGDTSAYPPCIEFLLTTVGQSCRSVSVASLTVVRTAPTVGGSPPSESNSSESFCGRNNAEE